MKIASPSSPLPAPARFLLGVTFALALCFVLQAVCYYGLDWKTGKGESNYFSTLSRFQAAANPPAEIAFAGSSITGRLPGREVGNATVANLGSDGGPALDGIGLIVAGVIAPPKCLVIETNTMYGGVGFGDSLITRNARSPWFRVGSRVPLLGAAARPSAMLYSQLLRRPRVLEGAAFAVSLSKVTPPEGFVMSDLEEQRFQRYQEAIHKLQSLGVRVVLAQYPAGKMREREDQLMRATVDRLQQSASLPFLNLEEQVPRDELGFTDPVHLDPASAARILSTFQSYLSTLTPP